MRNALYLFAVGLIAFGVWYFMEVAATPLQVSQPEVSSHPLSSQKADNASSDTPTVNSDAVPPVGRPFTLDEQVKDWFDRVIFENEGSDRSTMLTALQALLKEQGITTNLDYANALFGRYLDYKASLQQLDAPFTDANTTLMQAQQRLTELRDQRYAYFSDEEYDALFADDARYDDAALQRLRIATDQGLSKEAREALIDEQLANLPADLQVGFKASLDTRKAQEIRNTYTSDTDRYNALAAEFGDDVANRMLVAWKEQHTWKDRVREVVDLKNAGSNAATQVYIEAHFSEQEQRRLRVFLENPALLEGD